MILVMTQIALALAIPAAPVPVAERGLVARYSVDEESGTILEDQSGKGYAGTIHLAEWVHAARDRSLAFRNAGSYVDCGTGLARRLAGNMTVAAWVRLTPSAYPDGSTNWTIVDCEDYARSGFIIRVDGQTAKLYYRASAAGRTPDGFSKATILKDVWHHVSVTRGEIG